MPHAAPQHAADRLLNAIEKKQSPVCVGIDPVVAKLPRLLQPRSTRVSSDGAIIAFNSYCRALLDAVAPFVPCVKFQSACFERFGPQAVDLLASLIKHASATCDLEVILDAKRGDIGISAEHYAAAAFGDPPPAPHHADWITVHSYLGEDSMQPFLQPGCGAFALVRTSNPAGDEIQSRFLNDGKTVAQAIAEIVARTGADTLGQSGYSSLGAVVGATKRDDAAALRKIMPQQIFLVPGYGAQGGTVDDVLPCFNSDGRGAIVTASRSVIYAFEPDDPNWAQTVGRAAEIFADEVGRASGMR